MVDSKSQSGTWTVNDNEIHRGVNSPADTLLTIVTFNCGQACKRKLPFILAEATQLNADFICLQEIGHYDCYLAKSFGYQPIVANQQHAGTSILIASRFWPYVRK